MPWRIVVSEGMERWPDPFLLYPKNQRWIEAPDGIVPEYIAKRYSNELEADAFARRLRAYGYVAATESVD